MAKQIKTYFLADGLLGFTLPAMFFSVGDVFFTDFSFEVFLSNLPPLPFTSIFAPFSEPHQAVIFVLGAKVTPGLYGKARSSLLFSGKISSLSGIVFFRKTLHSLIPTFLSTRNENDRCDRKTH
ncbi:hypothetical protein [Bacteroides ovatus]|uniref:hypothetical protein n=1 Tax=Bacteroides ovatus TaxID=28116 RepID=UPI002543CF10|nr:hypothetical protein [Bacteroides ovatus]WII04732.1 hypothetical protein OU990_03605 [Bacteroides ovatus]